MDVAYLIVTPFFVSLLTIIPDIEFIWHCVNRLRDFSQDHQRVKIVGKVLAHSQERAK